MGLEIQMFEVERCLGSSPTPPVTSFYSAMYVLRSLRDYIVESDLFFSFAQLYNVGTMSGYITVQ